MVTTSYLKAQPHLQVFTSKSPFKPSSISMKINSLIHNILVSRVRRVVRALSKAKTTFVEIFSENQLVHLICSTKSTKKKHRNMKLFLGSFRLHYNWCSSHVLPVPEPIFQGISGPHLCYDSNWNAIVTSDHYKNIYNENNPESQLSSYLHWLEEKVEENVEEKYNNNGDGARGEYNEIDRLADLFIASCHEKFILEKQESYRRFQEMMARSI